MFRVWTFGVMVAGSVAAVAGCSFTPGEFTARDAPAGGSADASLADARPLDAAPIPILFLQEAIATNAGSHAFVTTPFPQPLTAGSTIVAVISWSSTNQLVFGVADNSLNPYSSATALAQAQGRSQRIYFASNVKAGGTAVSVALTSNVTDPTLRVFEYSGITPTDPVDNTSSASASTGLAQAGPVQVRQDNELLFAATTTATTATGAGADYTPRQTTAGRFVEDRIVDTQGSYSATVPLASAGGWIMQLVAFKGIL
jgi:hypothetical protein